jgi:hypothetical protein
MVDDGHPRRDFSWFKDQRAAEAARARAGTRPAESARRSEPWWAIRSAARNGFDQQLDYLPVAVNGSEPPFNDGVSEPGRRPIGPAMIAAIALLVTLIVIAHVSDPTKLSRVLVPVIGLLGAIGFASMLKPRHPEEPWLARYLIIAMLVKIGGTVLRYTTLLKRGQLGDASVYDIYGQRYANAWLGRTRFPPPALLNLKSSNFLRWFTGVVYYFFGRDLITGFFVFSLIAFVGSYMWYRAAAVAIPFLDRRLFFILMFFAPSIVFWPAGVGKEALVEFGLGGVALGVAYILNGHLLYGLLVSLPGAWLTYVVRAHLLGLSLLALAFAYVLGRQRTPSQATVSSSLAKPIGIVVVVMLAAFGVTQGAKRLHISALTPSAIQTELQATSVSTTQEHSAFSTNVSLSPLHLPQDIVTVLLRPFPWEVQSKNQILASLEGIGLAAFIFIRRKSVALSLRMVRDAPFLLYAWILTVFNVLLFQAFGNFGLLVRERSIVLPALYILISLDVNRARRAEAARAEARAAQWR